MKIQVTLNPDEIKHIIKDHLFTKFSTVDDVELKVTETISGHEYTGYKVNVVTAVTDVEI